MNKQILAEKLGWTSKSYSEMTKDEAVLITQWYLEKFDVLTTEQKGHLRALCLRLITLTES